jgi:hypothetical protein
MMDRQWNTEQLTAWTGVNHVRFLQILKDILGTQKIVLSCLLCVQRVSVALLGTCYFIT